MAHSDIAPEASTAPAQSGDATEDLADFLGLEPEEEEQDSDEESDDEPESEGGDEPEAEEGDEAQDSDDEPEEPAIDAPVSWGADAKELFAQLPAELQQQVASREAQRERLVQQKTTEAADARRTAEIEAHQAVAELQRSYAAELDQFATELKPVAPDPAMLRYDPEGFYVAQQKYERANAQQQYMLQQAEASRQAAAQRETQTNEAATVQRLQQADAALAQAIPEYADPGKRDAVLTNLFEVGAALGYTKGQMLGSADAIDFTAVATAAKWKAGYDKNQAHQKSIMEKVRSAKKLPKVVKPGVAPTRTESSATRRDATWQQVKAARSKSQQADALADYFEQTGLM